MKKICHFFFFVTLYHININRYSINIMSKNKLYEKLNILNMCYRNGVRSLPKDWFIFSNKLNNGYIKLEDYYVKYRKDIDEFLKEKSITLIYKNNKYLLI